MIDPRSKFEETAQALTGRVILLRFRQPPTARAGAEAYRPTDAPSLCLIDIAPQPIEQAFKMLLHECAHIALGHVDQVTPTTTHQEQSGAIVLPARYWQTDHPTDSREQAANDQAAKWEAWAALRAAPFIDSGDTPEYKVTQYLIQLNYYRRLGNG